MLTIAALAMLSVLTMTYYASIGQSGRSLAQSNAGLTATTIATSFIERAQSTAFDCKTDTSSAAINNPNALTHWDSLGRESAAENNIDAFNDFDDFNGWVQDYTPGWMNERYQVSFNVYYVDTSNIEVSVAKKTYLKRMDLTVLRTYPPVDTNVERNDPVHLSTIYGYFKFN